MTNEREIKGKSVFVTGSASGIGALIAEYFLKEGAKYMFLSDINETLGKKTAEDFKAQFKQSEVFFIKCDVADDEQLDDALKKAITISGKLDVLVNNAGLMSEQIYMKMVDVNVKGTINASYKALKHMRADRGGSGGSIVNISSVLGGVSSPFLPGYQATKSAVIMFSNSLGMTENYSRTKVRVFNVAFGPSETNLLQGLEHRGMDEEMCQFLGTMNVYRQKPESAAVGVIEAFKRAESGSTWCIINDEPVVERTEMVNKGFDLFFPPKSMNFL